MGIGGAPCDVALQAVDEGAAEYVRSDAVEREVADHVGNEVDAAVAGEIGKLHVDVVHFLLHRDHAEVVALDLILVERGRVEGVAGVESRDGVVRTNGRVGAEHRRQPHAIGNLEFRHIRAVHRDKARRLVEDGRGIPEESGLFRHVMDRLKRGRGILDADAVSEVAADEEIFGLPDDAAVLDAGREGAVTATVDAHAALAAGTSGDARHRRSSL